MESVDIIVKAINRAKATLGEIGRDLKGVGREAKKLDKDTSKKAVIGLRQWQSELKKTQKNVQSLRDASQGIIDVSKKLLMAGVAMGAAVFFPIKQAGEFESAMAKVKAIMTDISEETFERMKAQARSLGETTRYTATQSAEAFVFLAMAGLNAIEAMEALPGTLQLAAAGGLDLAEAADLATNVLAGLGFQVDQLGRVNDVLARAASRANTSVRELGEAMKIAGPAAKGSKEEFEAIVAVLGGMADAGIKGGEAGNAVKRMLILLQNPTAKARVELERLNVPLTDSEGKFRGLIPILRDLGEAQMDLSASAKIFGLYTGAAAIAASGQAEKMGRLTKELRNAKGAAEEMAKVMLDTLPGALTLLKSAVEGLMLAVASPLMGMLKEIVGAIAEMVSMVTALVKATGPVAPMLLGLVTILAGMALSVGALGMVVGGLIYGFAQWTVAMKMITVKRSCRIVEECLPCLFTSDNSTPCHSFCSSVGRSLCVHKAIDTRMGEVE
jgi:TP901 family phage tail tape measure protein